MLYINDMFFTLEDDDFLSFEGDGPLSENNINDTINDMASRIAGVQGYSVCTPFGTDNFTMLDALFEEDKSVAIPIFIERRDVQDNKANVSFLVFSSKSGIISKPDGQQDYAVRNATDSKYNTVKMNRVFDVRYYRHATDDKFDCYPMHGYCIGFLYYTVSSVNEVEVHYSNINLNLNYKKCSAVWFVLPSLSPSSYKGNDGTVRTFEKYYMFSNPEN